MPSQAGYTPLGRGLVATQPATAGATLLAVEWCHMLAVADRPGELPAGPAFSKRVLQDWQLLHGKMPPLLVSYLLSGGWNVLMGTEHL